MREKAREGNMMKTGVSAEIGITWVLVLALTAGFAALAPHAAAQKKITIGVWPNLGALDSLLKVGESTRLDVYNALGKPFAEGREMMPIRTKQRTQWTYYYEEGVLKESRRVFLFIFLDGDRFDGYMWFSSLPVSAAVPVEKPSTTAPGAATARKPEMPTIATQEKPPEPQQESAPTQAPPSTAPMVQAKLSPTEKRPEASKHLAAITAPAFPPKGTRYAYRVRRLGESRIEKYVVLGEGVYEGKRVHQVELESKQGLVLFDLKTGNWMRTVVSGKTVGNADPYEDIFRYPLEVGKKYQCEFFYFDYILSGHTKTNIEVSAFEDVSVPAGTFMAYKIIAEEIFIASGNPFSLNVSTLGQQIRAKTFWYSPDLKIVIKVEDTDRRYSITTRTELMEYSEP